MMASPMMSTPTMTTMESLMMVRVTPIELSMVSVQLRGIDHCAIAFFFISFLIRWMKTEKYFNVYDLPSIFDLLSSLQKRFECSVPNLL